MKNHKIKKTDEEEKIRVVLLRLLKYFKYIFSDCFLFFPFKNWNQLNFIHHLFSKLMIEADMAINEKYHLDKNK